MHHWIIWQWCKDIILRPVRDTQGWYAWGWTLEGEGDGGWWPCFQKETLWYNPTWWQLISSVGYTWSVAVSQSGLGLQGEPSTANWTWHPLLAPSMAERDAGSLIPHPSRHSGSCGNPRLRLSGPDSPGSGRSMPGSSRRNADLAERDGESCFDSLKLLGRQMTCQFWPSNSGEDFFKLQIKMPTLSRVTSACMACMHWVQKLTWTILGMVYIWMKSVYMVWLI